jgi:large subunit ribosomal protein L15
MKYNELQTTKKKNPRRVGRGIAAGRGKTAGRGTKGQGSRKSGGVRPGFEGGQIPLYMRLPKLRGFKSHHVAATTVYTSQLSDIKDPMIDNESLVKAGLVSSPYETVKVLFKGEITNKKEVRLQAASQKAQEAIEAAGGNFTGVARLARPKAKTKKA